MSNPYGEEPTPYAPYGGNAYGNSYPYGPPATGPGTDPVSITGFVLSLLCCTSFVGVILGLVGLSRTKNGVRGGRWAAVSAIVIGAAGTLAFVGIIGFFTWYGTSTVLLSNADVGQCLDVDELSGDDATLFEKDCDEPHEAEVAVADEFSSTDADAYTAGDPGTVCDDRLSDEYRAALESGEYDLGIVFETEEPETNEPFICYLERSDGDDLEAPVVD